MQVVEGSAPIMAATSTASAQAQQKFSNIRRRLDQLGYKQTLGIESLPLVEKLFADLVHTTESLKNSKLELSKKVSDSFFLIYIVAKQTNNYFPVICQLTSLSLLLYLIVFESTTFNFILKKTYYIIM